jgi:aspartate/methionine/tyrosine aminotransferase
MSFAPAKRMEGIQRTLIRQIFDSAPSGAINLGLGQPDLPTPDVVAREGMAGIARGETGYTSTAGKLELRRAIAQSLRPFVSGPDEVLVTVGSQEAMFAACLSLVDPGDEILYPDPGYPAYPVVARLIGARAVAYPLRAERRFRLDPADVEARLSERSRAVILCAPSNPTGACIDPGDLAELTTLLERRGVPWLSDEIYSGFHYGDRFHSPAELSPSGGLVISGLSKDLSMTGWRIGWVAGAAEVIAKVVAAHQYLVTCACSVSQSAALAAFTPQGRSERERYLEIFRRRRGLMGQLLAAIPGVRAAPPDGAFYYFADVSAFGESLDIARRILRRQEVVTIPGEAFGRRGSGFLRISFANSDDAIREGVERIARELELLRRDSGPA